MKPGNRLVFINCPFDDAYRDCFEAIVFTVYMSGYQPVCALDDDNFGDVRLHKLKELIERCDRTIHDLSRTEPSRAGLPRFNMPFELGMTIGAMRYGGVRQRRKRALVMVEKPYIMAKFLSDAAGQDPRAHGGKPRAVIALVRNHLKLYYRRQPTRRNGVTLPGATHFCTLFDEFKRDLPALARTARLTAKEIDPFRGGYHDFLEMIAAFASVVRTAGRIGLPRVRPVARHP